MQQHIIAVTNQKGGVGKTTTAINIASYLGRSGKSVLIVDLDPQGNTTSGLGLEKRTIEHSIADGLLDDAVASSLIKDTAFDGIRVIPTNPALASAELKLVNELGREQRLKKLLSHYDFDYVFIDCPPSLSLLTINGLTAASHVLIPVQAEFYALEGLGQLLETIQQVRQALNPDLELLGVLLTMFDNRTSLSNDVHAEVKKHFPGKVFSTVIPRNIRLAEAPSHGMPIADHDKWSKGARAYKKLAKEVEQRLKR